MLKGLQGPIKAVIVRVPHNREASEVSLLPDDWNHSEFWVVEMSRTEATAGLAWRRQLSVSSGMKIFLSHKSTDKDAVTDFQKTLRYLGYDPWLDEDAMPAGTPKERGLLQGMQEACAAVFFITPSFKDDGYLATEIDYALEEKRAKNERFAIITLRLGGNGDASAPQVPELLKRFIWKTPKTSLEALREIVRALPVVQRSMEWRDDVTGTDGKPQLRFPIEALSSEARSILQEAVRGDGRVTSILSFGGQSIKANGKEVIPNQDSRTTARWLGGLEELALLCYFRALVTRETSLRLQERATKLRMCCPGEDSRYGGFG